MRTAFLIGCSLLAAAPAAWAQSTGNPAMPAETAVRCAAVGERLPQAMDITLGLARQQAASTPALQAEMGEVEKAMTEARANFVKLSEQLHAQALAAVGGDKARLERELAAARKDYAAMDGAPSDIEAMKPALDRLKTDAKACQAAAKSQASPAAG